MKATAEWYIDGGGHEQAERMLMICFGTDAQVMDECEGRSLLLYKCELRHLQESGTAFNFEDTCRHFGIPVTIYVRGHDGILRLWRSAPIGEVRPSAVAELKMETRAANFLPPGRLSRLRHLAC